MKTKNITLALAFAIGLLAMTACGSKAYRQGMSALDDYEKAIKNAKSCSDLIVAHENYPGYDAFDGEDSELSDPEDETLQDRERDIETLAKRKAEELCK